ncbi:MAG: 5-fold beta-flower protein, partial [Bacteroidota bacterium]
SRKLASGNAPEKEPEKQDGVCRGVPSLKKGSIFTPETCTPPAMRHLLFLTLLLSTTASAQRLYDSAGHLTGRVDGNRFYDASGKLIGRDDKNRIYDGSGRQIGRTEGARIYDAAGKSLGRVDDGRFYDAAGKYIGRVDGNRLYDGSGRQIARADGLQQRYILIFFYFFM